MNIDMSANRSDSEFAIWLNTTPEQRSLLVEVLHWFHYRPSALKRSWAREEAITWELLRALELLPQSHFLRPILHELARISSKSQQAIEPLLAARDITITRYPSLKLAGGKRNCRSDIGLGLSGGPTVWVEAKTAPFKDTDLRNQLIQQQQALKRIFPQSATTVITLLPWGRALQGIPNITWSHLAELLQNGVEKMREAMPDREYRAGYEQLAIETIGRIRSHPNRIAENLPPPDKSSGPRTTGRRATNARRKVP